MNVIYTEQFNIDLGLLRYLHPFDGAKFRKIHSELALSEKVKFFSPDTAVDKDAVDAFLSSVMQHRVRNKNGILQALEVPKIPFISLDYLDTKILTPMRWGVAGTLLGASKALIEGGVFWNLSGGYHHATQQNMEGFCIYNDIGICHQQLIKKGLLTAADKVLIIDTDAHHGNGNAYTFMDNTNVTLLDIYNASVYPSSDYTRDRVDIPVKLKPGTDGETYLQCLREALDGIRGTYKLAFVVAGTDVLASDKLGGLKLSVDDVAEREKITLEKLKSLGVPTVLLGGGGYSKESSAAVTNAILHCETLE
ncbi:MAG: histone deacetylase 11 [Candidatus Azotimanducaceae bacterium]|jgi:histone deacetylase 11